MEKSYTEICKRLNVGVCYINIISKEIHIDDTLKSGLNLNKDTFTYNQVLEQLNKGQRKELENTLLSLPNTFCPELNICLERSNKLFYLSILFDKECDKDGVISCLVWIKPATANNASINLNDIFPELRKIYDHIPVGIELFDKNGILLDLNEEDKKIFGIKHPEKIRGLSILDNHLIDPKIKQAFREMKNAEISTKYDLSEIGTFYDSSISESIDIITKGVPLSDNNGTASHYILVHIDNTEKIKANSKIEDFEKLFSNIADFAGIGYCKYDVLSKKGFAISQWYKNIGEEDGAEISEILNTCKHAHPDDVQRIQEAYTSLATGALNNLEIEIRIRDGESWKWILNNVITTKYDPLGGSIELVALNSDISKHRNMQLELTERIRKIDEMAAQREMVFNNLSAIVSFVDSDFVVQWSSSKKIKNIPRQYMLRTGETCHSQVHGISHACEDCPLDRAFKSGKKEIMHRREGDETLEVAANPVFDGDGKVSGVVLKIENITKRVEQDRTLKKFDSVIGAIMDNIPVFLFVKDPNIDFKYLYWNREMEKRMGLLAANVVGKTDFEIFPNGDIAEIFRKEDLSVLDHHEKREYETTLLDPTGKEMTLSSLKVLVPSENNLPWIMGISWDITDIKEKEKELIISRDKAEESDKFKSSFLANMSHEIRTPLNAIVGFSELLTDDDLKKEEKADYMRIIHKNNELLLQLIADILDLSKIEANKLQINYDKIDIHTLCNRIALQSNMKARSEVPIIFNNNLPHLTLFSDENRVQQIISNFVNNAIKFTKTGHIEIGYELIKTDEIRIYVKDTGVGISEDKLNTVFGRFVKLNTFIQGTGLGLSICKSLIKLLKGDIGVESKKDEGSCFWITLPYDSELKIN